MTVRKMVAAFSFNAVVSLWCSRWNTLHVASTPNVEEVIFNTSKIQICMYILYEKNYKAKDSTKPHMEAEYAGTAYFR